MQPVRLSYTRIKDLSCPARFQRVNMQGTPERTSPYALDGILLHEVAANYIKQLDRIRRPRASQLFGTIFGDHAALLSAAKIDALLPVANNFCEYFKMPKGHETVRTEWEMAVTREGEPIPISDALHPTGMPKLDCFTGIADAFWTMDGGRRGWVADWKFGYQRFLLDEVFTDWQLKGYAYLALKQRPDMESVVLEKFAPRFRHPSMGEFPRERIIEEFEGHLSEAWTRVDEIRAEFGNGRYAEDPGSACQWCRLPGCRVKEEICNG